MLLIIKCTSFSVNIRLGSGYLYYAVFTPCSAIFKNGVNSLESGETLSLLQLLPLDVPLDPEICATLSGFTKHFKWFGADVVWFRLFFLFEIITVKQGLHVHVQSYARERNLMSLQKITIRISFTLIRTSLGPNRLQEYLVFIVNSISLCHRPLPFRYCPTKYLSHSNK